MRQMRTIKAVAPLEERVPPRVSVINPACNEALTIEPALASVLALDYADLEIIAINDRFTDDAGLILARMQKQHQRLRIIDVDALPKRT